MSRPGQIPQRTTLKDVAARAGVALSTASRVFAGKSRVASATRDRVWAAAEELGYGGPDPAASSLRTGRSGVVAVIVEGKLGYALRDPYALALLDGLVDSLDETVGVLLVPQAADNPENAGVRLRSAALDAAVFLGCGTPLDPLVAELRQRGLPLVAIGATQAPGVVRVDIDNRAAARDAAEHLHGLGHRRVACVTFPILGGAALVRPLAEVSATTSDAESRQRLAGVAEVFGDQVPTVAALTADLAGGMAAAALLWQPPPSERPTAVIAHSDVLALGVISELELRGLSVPGDVSVVGFDGIEAPWWPGVLTTIVQPGTEKGAEGGRRLVELLHGRVVDSVVLPARLRIGTSTGHPA